MTPYVLSWHQSGRHHIYVMNFIWAPAPSQGSLLEIASSLLVRPYGERKLWPGAFPWVQVVISFVLEVCKKGQFLPFLAHCHTWFSKY